jgi:hypothetical protein
MLHELGRPGRFADIFARSHLDQVGLDVQDGGAVYGVEISNRDSEAPREC